MSRLLSLRARPLLGGQSVLELASASAQVLAGQVVGQVAGFATSVLVARQVGPEAFGAYSFAVVAATLMAGIPGAGLDMSAVRVSSRHRWRHPARARSVLLLSALAKAGVALAVMVAGWLLAAPLAESVLARSELTSPIRFAVVAAVGLVLRDSTLAVLQAGERFGQMALVNLASAASRVGLVVVLVGLGMLTLVNALAAFLAAMSLAGAMGALIAWRMLGGELALSRDLARELASFSRWLVLATVLGTVANNLDVLALTRLGGAEAGGVYLAARTLALPIGMGGAAVSTALLPKLARVGAPEQAWSYIRHVGLRLGLVTAVAAAALVLTAPALVGLVYGARFAEAVPIFRLLVLLYSAQLLTWPAVTLLMVIDRPELVALLNGLLLVGTGAGYGLAVPRFGAIGTAAVFATGVVLALPPCYLLAWRLLARTADAPVQRDIAA